MSKTKPTTIAEYIDSAPKEAQKNLCEMYILSAMKPFKNELAQYKTGNGSIQFPHDKRLPKALICKIAALRVSELRDKDVRWV
jgi:hypothetical protein